MNAAAASLAEIAPLLDAGVVRTFFVPPSARGHDLPTGGAAARVREQPILASQDEIWDAFEASFVSGLGPHLAELWARIRAGDKSPPLELVERAASEGDPTVVEVFVQVLSELRPAAVVDNAIGIVAESLGDLHRLGGRYDLLCPTPLFARLALTGDPLQEMRLHELAHLQVPGLDQLLVEDVVSMRTHSDAFALWRARLSTGLERARGLRLEFGPEVDVLTPVAEVLQDARAALFQEVERSRTLSAHARSALGFVSGAIGGAVGNATSGSAGAAVGAAGGVLAFVLERILAAGDPLPGFLRRHYVVFDR
jgi:hypothetical protein